MNKKTLIYSDVASHLLKDIRCYTNEWKRTNPDFAVYLPKARTGPDAYSDHLLVSPTPGGDLLAIWTMSTLEGSLDTRVMYARSENGGTTWTVPQVLVGREGDEGVPAFFGFPVISKTGRIYCYYGKDKDIYDVAFRITAVLGCHYSDDDGRSWKDSGHEFGHARTRYDHPDPKVPCNAVIWQKPVLDAKGRQLVTFTRVSSLEVRPYSAPNALGQIFGDVQGGLMRFENIDEGPDPADVKITWIEPEDGVFRHPIDPAVEPQRSRGYSEFLEPSVAVLPDGRLFVTASTVSGFLLYTVSEDGDGLTWRQSEPLRYMDQGRGVLHPQAPAPFYRIQDGRYLLFYSGHDGSGYLGPRDRRGRRPMCVSVGECRPDAYQPIWFSQPKQLCDTDGVRVGPELLPGLA